MNYYKIHKDNWSTVQKFETLEEAQAFASSLGDGYTAEFYKEYEPITAEARLSMDFEFTQNLVKTFVQDNRDVQTTQDQIDGILVKFRDVLAFAQTGAVESIYAHLPNIPTDEIFTQERKDKYLEMITTYLAQFE